MLCENFIIISGYEKFEYAQTAIQYGVRGYLLKPIDKNELLALIDEVYQSLPQNYSKKRFSKLPEIDYFDLELYRDDYPTSLRKVIAYMDKQYMTQISLQSLSDEFMLHPNYISSLFSKYTDTNFKYILDYIRLKKAVELLLMEQSITLSEISYLVGYNNERRLYDAFQKRLHCTPGEFKARYASSN